jgi:hemoglobin/transferrin/lactoferrin receptor protein
VAAPPRAAAQTPAQPPASTAPSQPQTGTPAAAAPDKDKVEKDKEAEKQQPQFFNTVTVTATMSPTAVKDTPGTVSVIDAEAIARGMIENAADLIKFEPGVYVESNITRIGLNGFNIRGIGGNRVMTQIDGVETTEQFDFGPFNVHQFGVDLDTLKTAEVVRSAGSSMYGSDALGGVVSFFTKDPADYLAGQRLHIGAKTLYDGRARDASGNVVLAGGSGRVQASLFSSYVNGHEPRNKGTVKTDNATRTALNPQDRRGVEALGKVVVTFDDGNVLRGAVEVADNRVETLAYSLKSAAVLDTDSTDTMQRQRFSVDQALTGKVGLNTFAWSLYVQQSDTDQVVDEFRAAAGPTPALNRSATLDYTQDSFGGTVQGRKAFAPGGQAVLLTFGGNYKHHTFDMLRDRLDLNAATGAVIPVTNLILPTKYFPKSQVGETGSYLQAEMRVGRLTLLPGVRFDRFSLDADSNDQVFIASLSPAAADFSDHAVSSRLGASFRASNAVTVHAQYAGGFRAPPYSAVNSGFTNLQGGYTSLPNPDLRAETSDNFEVGVRSTIGRVSVGATTFSNRYADFIQQVARGTNPSSGLLEYQYQNVSKVRINGLELQGEARITGSLRLRAAYALIRGNDVSAETDVPLNTIAPDQAVFGLQYGNSGGRWGSDLTLRAVAGQSASTAGTGMFAPDSYQVVDLSGWLSLGHSVTLRAAALNLTDSKYFEWTNVRGRSATDATIDRYSSPGASGMVSLSYGW